MVKKLLDSAEVRAVENTFEWMHEQTARTAENHAFISEVIHIACSKDLI